MQKTDVDRLFSWILVDSKYIVLHFYEKKANITIQETYWDVFLIFIFLIFFF